MMRRAATAPASRPERKTHTTVDTIELDRALVESWLNPPFQRPLRINDKVVMLSQQIHDDGGVLPGILTLGVLDGETYLVDGQHRKAAFLLTPPDTPARRFKPLETGYTDVRIRHFETMGEMADEFVRLNSQLVRMRPDDILRGLEASCAPLQRVREQCPFVGYDMIRRGDKAPILSASLTLRAWRGSANEVPATSTSSSSASSLACLLTEEEAARLIAFLRAMMDGVGRDPEYVRLWGSLNLILCMWLWRRIVLKQSVTSPKMAVIGADIFRKCLMSLSADHKYLDWLAGRHLGERDRSPAYLRIKQVFVQRISQEMKTKPLLPAPAWAS
jgi:hypothetical protein